MLDLTPSQVAEQLGAAITPGTDSYSPSSSRISRVVTDSREVAPGSLFIAIEGERVDGHDFVDTAFDQGAVAAIVSRMDRSYKGPTITVANAIEALGVIAKSHLQRLRHQSPDLTVVGVTGSVGKTTTKDLLGHVLSPLGEVIVPKASFNNEIGLPLTVLQAGLSTRVLVLEMGTDKPGDLTYLTQIAPLDIAVVLIVAGAHLQAFGSLQGVAEAKAEILQGLGASGIAVLNGDDGLVRRMAKDLETNQVRFFGEGQGCHFRADNISTTGEGHVRFTFTQEGVSTDVELGLVGEHNLTNALAAASVGQLLGVEPVTLVSQLASAKPRSAHRMNVVDVGGVRVVDDAYNANPTSMKAALKTLADMAARTGRRSVAVLGQMLELGEHSIEEHDAIGRFVVRLNINKLLTVGDGARALHSGAYQEGSWGDEANHVDSIAQARQWLDEELRSGDIVLFKSSNAAGLALLAEQVMADLKEADR